MFVTYPTYEFRMPVGLAAPDARHWRTMELSLHLPWFILSLENQRHQAKEAIVQTYCFSWDDELAAFLGTVDQDVVCGLACMAPGWKSTTGHWTSHEVSEVWLVHDDDGLPFLELIGANGLVLDVGIRSESQSVGRPRTLLLKHDRHRHRGTAGAG